ncbi:YqaA family protein [Nitrosophilus kaiyonis]|uniref:YqaA family protein n=1 Tax=Nitrosophilus kaiyonis TaxID=2930200 RepID=UPI002492B72C|nr:YqaA family protein [Nitrosophilus kaiyonis]
MKELIIIFLSAFGAATILPIYSEATVLYYLNSGYPKILILISAGFGNTLGSLLNFFIGKKGVDYLLKKGYVKEKNLLKAEKFFKKYGGFALLFSWAPIIGDPLTFIAGSLHYDIKKFIIIVAIAKFARYYLLIEGFNIFIK